MATGEQTTSVTPRSWRAAQTPTTSTSASERADLVEVHVVGRRAVQGALDLGQGREGVVGVAVHVGGQPARRRVGQQVSDGGPRAVVVAFAGGGDDGAGGGDAARRTGSTSRAHPSTPSVPTAVRTDAEVGAGVEQGAEEHVAGDAGEAVDPGRPRRGLRAGHLTSRSTALAAP